MFRCISKSILAGWLLAILPAFLAGSASAQWGDLKVHFQADGKPKQAVIVPGKAGLPKVPNESFVVDKDGNLKEVVVWLMPGETTVDIHPAYAKAAKDKIVLNALGGRFVPHVALVRAGQTFVMTNGDMFGYNPSFNLPENKVGASVLIAPGDSHTLPDFTKSERRPQPVSCSIHPWMNAWVLVQDHPYMATSGDDGNLLIKDLPVGKHTFMFWQENTGYIPANGKLKTLKGKAEIEIEDGKATDLGTVLVKYNAR